MKGTWEAARDPLTALRRGDTAPFEAFVASEKSTFLGFFRRLGASPEESKDLTQKLFLKLFRHASTYEPSGRFAAFAFRVARNAWIDEKRRRAARPSLAQAGSEGDEPDVFAHQPTDDPSPGEHAMLAEEAERVRVALAQLSDGHKTVFELGVVQELPYHEISELLGVPEGTVKSRMFHAVRKLRELLEEPCGPSAAEPLRVGTQSWMDRAARKGGRA